MTGTPGSRTRSVLLWVLCAATIVSVQTVLTGAAFSAVAHPVQQPRGIVIAAQSYGLIALVVAVVGATIAGLRVRDRRPGLPVAAWTLAAVGGLGVIAMCAAWLALGG